MLVERDHAVHLLQLAREMRLHQSRTGLRVSGAARDARDYGFAFIDGFWAYPGRRTALYMGPFLQSFRVDVHLCVQAAEGQRRHALVALEEPAEIPDIPEAAGAADLLDVAVALDQHPASVTHPAPVHELGGG